MGNCSSKNINSNNKNINNKVKIVGNTQFPSSCKSRLSDQHSRFLNNSSNPKTSNSKDNHNNNRNISHNKNTVAGNIQFPTNCKSDLTDQLIGYIDGNVTSSIAEQLPQQHYKDSFR